MKQSYIIHITSRKNNDRNHLAKTVQLLKRQHCNKITHNYAAQEQEDGHRWHLRCAAI